VRQQPVGAGNEISGHAVDDEELLLDAQRDGFRVDPFSLGPQGT